MSTMTETDHTTAPLSDQDLDRLHNEDVHAARIVVGLMTGVFFMGLLLYSFILWVVW